MRFSEEQIDCDLCFMYMTGIYKKKNEKEGEVHPAAPSFVRFEHEFKKFY